MSHSLPPLENVFGIRRLPIRALQDLPDVGLLTHVPGKAHLLKKVSWKKRFTQLVPR